MWSALILIGAIIFLVWCLSSPFYWRKRNVPYHLPLPLFGNFFKIITKGVIDFNKYLYESFPDKPFYGVHFFIRPTLIVKDPELTQEILVKDFEHFTSHGFYSNQDRDTAGANIFHIHGQQWKNVRGNLSRYFTPARIRAMLLNADDTIKKAMEVIDADISNNRPTDMRPIILNTTVEISTKAIFGVKADSFTNKNSVFTEIAIDIFKPKLSYKICISAVSPRVYDLFKLNIFGEKCTDRIKRIVSNAVVFRRKENVRNMNDFLEGMMELADNYEESKEKFLPDNTRVPSYDLDSLICQATTIFSASVESTSLTMGFVLYELALNPEIQERCREEINSVLMRKEDVISVNELPKLIYLNAVLQETLRKYPLFNLVNRECTKDYRIPGTQVIIEKGTFLLLSPCGLQMDPKYFPNPQIFLPERFLTGSEIKSGTYFPFGMGPRTCLGMGLAMAEMKLVISRFLQRYEFSVCSKTDIPMRYVKYSILRTPLNGMWLNIRPIRKMVD